MIVPELLGEDEALVSRANALFQGATRATMLLGPVAGGVLIAFLSAPVVLAVDAATYAVSAVILKLFVPRPRQLPAGDEDTGVLRGIRFLAREPLLRVWTPVFAFGDAAWTAFFISVPVLVVDRFDADPRIAGWLIASFGVGAVLGNAVAFRFLLDRVRGLSLIAVGVLAQALPLWLLTIDLPPAAYSAALVASGLGNGLCNPSIHSLMTLRIPPALRPTVMTTMMMLFALVQPLAVFGVRPVLDAFGPEPVLIGFAVAQTVAMAVIAASALSARSAAPAEVRPRKPPDAARAGPAPAPLRAGRLVARLADDVPGAAVVRARDDGLRRRGWASSSPSSCCRWRSSGSRAAPVVARLGARRTMLVGDAGRAARDARNPAAALRAGCSRFPLLLVCVFADRCLHRAVLLGAAADPARSSSARTSGPSRGERGHGGRPARRRRCSARRPRAC